MVVVVVDPVKYNYLRCFASDNVVLATKLVSKILWTKPELQAEVRPNKWIVTKIIVLIPTKEVLEDMLIRELTRKYLKVLKLALVKDSVESSNSTSTAMEQDCEDQRPVHSSTEVISELGLRVLQCDTTCQAVTLCLLR